MKKHATLIVAGLALLWMTGSVGATTVDTWAKLTSTSQGLGCTVTYPVYDSSGHYLYNATESTVVGIYTFSQLGTGHPVNHALDDTFDAFCMDLKQFVYYSPTVSHWSEMSVLTVGAGADNGPWPGPAGEPMTDAQKIRLMKLFGEHYDDITPPTSAAAFGASVWEIVWERSATLNITEGDLRVSMDSAAQDLANTWLGELDSYALNYPQILGLLDATTQDQLVFIFGGTSFPVPEPVTMAGLVLGLGSLVGYIRRRRAA